MNMVVLVLGASASPWRRRELQEMECLAFTLLTDVCRLSPSAT